MAVQRAAHTHPIASGLVAPAFARESCMRVSRVAAACESLQPPATPALHAPSVRTGRRRRHVCSSQSARCSGRGLTDLAQFAPVAAHCLQHDARRHVGRNQETKRVLRLMRRLHRLPFCRRRQTPPPLLGRQVPRSGEIDRRGSQRGASSSLKCGSNKLGEGGQLGAAAAGCAWIAL